jgi:propanol-preferring alcohol dehydrogenase
MDRPVTPALGSDRLPATMPALRLPAWQAPPELVEVPVPRPGPGAVLLAVDAAGLCHSDLQVIGAAPGTLPYRPPFTLGHEVAGRVVRAGAGVGSGWVGRAVAVHGVWSCGTCRNCSRGRENYCQRLTGPIGCGLGRDGGLAEFMIVDDVRRLIPLDGLDPVLAAPLTDAGLTVYHALAGHREVLAGGGLAVVVGIGGLGHLAVQILRATTNCAVVAVDVREPARLLAARLGASAVAPTVGEAAAEIAQLSGGAGADLVLDLVGSTETLRAGAEVLAGGGALTVVGSAGGQLLTGKNVGMPRGWAVRAPFWGPSDELRAVLDLARTGVITATAEVVRLEGVVEAYQRLEQGDVEGRLVVVPDRIEREGTRE